VSVSYNNVYRVIDLPNIVERERAIVEGYAREALPQ
jgi:hypothetical protein